MNNKLTIETKASKLTGAITQTLKDSILDRTSRFIIDTTEKQIKEALIELGWTPPNSTHTVIDITNEHVDLIMEAFNNSNEGNTYNRMRYALELFTNVLLPEYNSRSLEPTIIGVDFGEGDYTTTKYVSLLEMYDKLKEDHTKLQANYADLRNAAGSYLYTKAVDAELELIKHISNYDKIIERGAEDN